MIKRYLILLTILLIPATIAALESTPAQANTALPDGRNYELVSPPNKNGNEITEPGEAALAQSTPSGLSITYAAGGAFENAVNGGRDEELRYLASRDATGWHTKSVGIRDASTFVTVNQATPWGGFSTDLTAGVLLDTDKNNPPLAPGAIAGVSNLYHANLEAPSLENGGLEVLTTTPPHPETVQIGYELVFEGGTPDLSHIVFSANDKFTENALYNNKHSNLYEWGPAGLQLVNVLPKGESAPSGSLGGLWSLEEASASFDGEVQHAVSDDGERVFWTAALREEGPIYMREMGTKRTVAVSASQKTNGTGVEGHDPNGPLPAVFRFASADGNDAIFTSCEKLTNDSTATSPSPATGCRPQIEGGENGIGNDLYAYDVQTESLKDLTVDNVDPEGAQVLGVLGASEEAAMPGSGEPPSYIYFLANGVLAPGATLGTYQQAPISEQGETNVYVWHEGTTRFIAHLNPNTSGTVGLTFGPLERQAYVTANGQSLAYTAEGEVHLYDATTSELTCVSCRADGEPSQGEATLPGWERQNYDPRSVSEDGDRVFFDSTDAILPQDTNNRQDVYEWERDGSGSCEQAPGCQYLLSTGTGSAESSFVDASESGDDVFIRTADRLVPQDVDTAEDLYDVHVCSSSEPCFSSTSGVASPCEGEACRGPATEPPVFGSPASSSFSGAGNVSATVVSSPAVAPKAKAKAPTRTQKLSAALKACKKDRARKKRVSCEKRARRAFRS